MTDPLSPAVVARTVEADVRQNHAEFLALTEELVGVDSGRDAPDGIAKVEAAVADRLEGLGGAIVEWRNEGGVDHVAVTLPGTDTRVALLGHADTVFAAGTATARPFHASGIRALGPGVADMKAGLAMAVMVCQSLVAVSGRPTIEFVIVGDEETRVIAPPFMDRLEGVAACFVLECGRPGGGFITERKGGFWVRLEAVGRSAHAGVEPERGTSAIVQLCQSVVAAAGLHRGRPDLTVSVGTIGGGSAPNVVASEAWADLDIRAFTDDDLEWARHEIARVAAEGATTVVPAGDWPPMTLVDDGILLAYQAAGGAISTRLLAQATGGMSDGCWTASAGIPTIDGVGPEGGNDHSPEEFIDLASVPIRAGALAGAITATTKPGGRQ